MKKLKLHSFIGLQDNWNFVLIGKLSLNKPPFLTKKDTGRYKKETRITLKAVLVKPILFNTPRAILLFSLK